jgi:adenosine deaminase
LDLLRAERIDHGVRALEDPRLVDRLARERVALTVCPLSNVRLRVVDSLQDHPFGALLRAGLKATINSDDPAYFGGYIGDNYVETQRALALSRGEMVQVARNSLEAAFVTDEERRALVEDLEVYVARHQGDGAG